MILPLPCLGQCVLHFSLKLPLQSKFKANATFSSFLGTIKTQGVRYYCEKAAVSPCGLLESIILYHYFFLNKSSYMKRKCSITYVLGNPALPDAAFIIQLVSIILNLAKFSCYMFSLKEVCFKIWFCSYKMILYVHYHHISNS